MSSDPVRAFVTARLARDAKCYVDRGDMLYVTDDRHAAPALERAGFCALPRGDFLAIGLTQSSVAHLERVVAPPTDALYARFCALRDRPVSDMETALLSRTIKSSAVSFDAAYDKRFRQTVAQCLRTRTGGALALCYALCRARSDRRDIIVY